MYLKPVNVSTQRTPHESRWARTTLHSGGDFKAIDRLLEPSLAQSSQQEWDARIDRFVIDSAGNIGRKTGTDGGLEWQTDSRYATEKDRFVYKSELRAFKAFFFSDKDNDPAGNWKRVDVNWKNTLSDKLNKVMSLDLYWEFLYDKQLDKAGQFKETLGVGVSYQLI